jgi:AraC-like DNA-binding protein
LGSPYTYVAVPPSTLAESGLGAPIVLLQRKLALHVHVQPHSHEWGQLIYASSGVLCVITETGRHIVPPEQAVWVPPGLVHEVIALSDASLCSLYLDKEQLQGFRLDCYCLDVKPVLKLLLAEAMALDTQAMDAVETHWGGPLGRLLRVIRDFLLKAPEIVLALPFPTDPRLLALIRTLLADPGDRRSLQHWQHELGASSRTLARLFKKETGLSFGQWQQRLRLQAAIAMLSRGESVLSVSLSLGYESASAFGYRFKQLLGVCPSTYRQGA